MLQQEKPTSTKQSRASVSQYRDVPFTLFDYTWQEVEHLQKLECEYIIFGKEECPTTGRPHLQGFVILKKRMTLIPVKRFLLKSYGSNNADRIHVDKRYASRRQAASYCRGGGISGKPANLYVYERGEYVDTKKDVQIRDALYLHSLGAAISDNISDLSISDLIAYEKLAAYLPPPPRKEIYVEWIWGISGSGKTRYVHDEVEKLGGKLYKVNSFDKFWSNYLKQPYILIDDFHKEESSTWFRCLLQVLDKYDYLVDKKYGGSWLYAERIYITAQHPPWHYWPPYQTDSLNPKDDDIPSTSDILQNEELAQVMRRINNIRKQTYNNGREIRLPTYTQA